MNNLQFHKHLEFGVHTIQICDSDGIQYPDMTFAVLATIVMVRRELLAQFKPTDCLWIDGVNEGKLIEVFKENV